MYVTLAKNTSITGQHIQIGKFTPTTFTIALATDRPRSIDSGLAIQHL